MENVDNTNTRQTVTEPTTVISSDKPNTEEQNQDTSSTNQTLPAFPSGVVDADGLIKFLKNQLSLKRSDKGMVADTKADITKKLETLISKAEKISKNLKSFEKRYLLTPSFNDFQKKKSEYDNLKSSLETNINSFFDELNAVFVTDSKTSIDTLKSKLTEKLSEVEAFFFSYKDLNITKGSNILREFMCSGTGRKTESVITLLKNTKNKGGEIKKLKEETQLVYGKGFKLDVNNDDKSRNFIENLKNDFVCFGELKKTFENNNPNNNLEANKNIKKLRELNSLDKIKDFNKEKTGSEQLYEDLPRIENFEYKKGKVFDINRQNSIKGDFVYNDNGKEEKINIEFKINSELGNFYANHAVYGCNMLLNIMSEHGWEIEKCGLVVGNEKINSINGLKTFSSNHPEIFKGLAGGCQNYQDFEQKLNERKGMAQQQKQAPVSVNLGTRINSVKGSQGRGY